MENKINWELISEYASNAISAIEYSISAVKKLDKVILELGKED